MASNVFVKDPDAILDYEWDWSDWLGTDTISTATVTADSGLTVVTTTKTTTTVTTWLSGGTVGISYKVKCEIVTPTRTDDRTIIVKVEQR